MAPMRLPPASRSAKPFAAHKPSTKPNISRTSSATSATISTKSSRSNLSKSASSSYTPKTSTSTFKQPKPAKPVKQEKAVFKGLSLSIAGNITDSAGTAQSHESIAKWFTVHGGTYDREVQSDTTHLICSIEEYKARGPQVQKAWKAVTKTTKCQIVVYDWLEDSLLGPKGSKKKRAEKGYTLDRTIARLKKGKTDHEKFRKSFEDGVRASKELCDNRLHKVYYDHTGFEYKIVLTRLDKTADRIKSEKYTLFLFESIASPHTYMTGAKLSRQYRPTSYYREVCRPKTWPEAFNDFRHFFHLKTQIDWDDRLEGIKKEGAFVYTPPILGRPVGLVKSGYVRPEWRTVDEVEYDTDSEVDDDEFDTEGGTSGNTSTTITSGEEFSTDASVEILGQREVLRNVSDGYGYQPDVIDTRPIQHMNLTVPENATEIEPTRSVYDATGRYIGSSQSLSVADGMQENKPAASVYDETGRYIGLSQSTSRTSSFTAMRDSTPTYISDSFNPIATEVIRNINLPATT